MQSVKHAVTSIVQRGRIGRTKSFVLALALALFVLPVATALAYFNATGTGTVANVQAGTSTSTVSITTSGTYSYFTGAAGGGSLATTLSPGGSIKAPLTVACTANPPCVVSSITLLSWSSDKTGCDSTTLPGSFAIASEDPALQNINITTLNGSVSGNIIVNWANLGVSQDACQGAKFTFTLNAG